jgi:hypothetical protein
VARCDAGGHLLDLRAIADVAQLGLCVDLRGESLEPLLPAREEDAAPAATGE